MASVFGHAAAAMGLGAGLYRRQDRVKLWLLGVFSAILPDFDVIAFRFGIPYESIWGHRGITHSIVFAAIWSLLIAWLFFSKDKKAIKISFIYLFLCTISHGILDAFTTGGLGVGFFIPVENTRYFFPWKVIQVSPLSLDKFLGPWGIKVLKSEFFYILIPSIILGVSQILYRKRTN